MENSIIINYPICNPKENDSFNASDTNLWFTSFIIKINNDIVEVIFIESDSTGDNYDIQTENEFGEKEFTQFSYHDVIPLYVFIETAE